MGSCGRTCRDAYVLIIGQLSCTTIYWILSYTNALSGRPVLISVYLCFINMYTKFYLHWMPYTLPIPLSACIRVRIFTPPDQTIIQHVIYRRKALIHTFLTVLQSRDLAQNCQRYACSNPEAMVLRHLGARLRHLRKCLTASCVWHQVGLAVHPPYLPHFWPVFHDLFCIG